MLLLMVVAVFKLDMSACLLFFSNDKKNYARTYNKTTQNDKCVSIYIYTYTAESSKISSALSMEKLENNFRFVFICLPENEVKPESGK